MLLTAVLAACVAPAAWGATYSVTMGTVDNGSCYIHDCTFTDDSTGTAASGYDAVAKASDGSGSEHILHFTSSTGTVEDAALIVKYNDFGIAGVDVDADTNVAKIGHDGTRKFYIGRTGVTSASTVDRDFKFEANNGIVLSGTQTWTVAENKTFTFTGSNITNNGDITISGNGSVDFSSKSVSGSGSIAVNGTLKNATFASGSTIGLNSGATLENVTLSDGSYVATTVEGGTTSGKQTVTKTWDLSSSTDFTAGTTVGLNIGGAKFAGTSSYENSTLTISTNVYNIAAANTVSVADISGVSGIVANGTLSNVSADNLTIPVIGSGTVQIGYIPKEADNDKTGTLAEKLSNLSTFVGTVELMDGAKLHFGNTNTYLSSADKIKINSGAYMTGWGAAFAHDIQLNGGNLAVNTGSWTGDIELTADSSIGMYAGTTISGDITATAGTTLTVKQETTIGTGSANTINLNGTKGKLDGATLDIQYGTVKINGRNDGNALIAGAIKVGAGAKLQVDGSDTLGYSKIVDGQETMNFTDSITAEGRDGSLATIQFDATQTMSTDLILKGYTKMTGSAFNSFDGDVTVTGTNNTIENAFNLRKDVTFTVNNTTVGDAVVKGSLAMKGAWTDTSGFSGKFIKAGEGDMTLSGLITSTRTFQIDNGTLNIGGKVNGQDEATANTMGTLDLSNNSNSHGVVNVQTGAALTVGTLWGCSTSYLALEEGATLTVDNVAIVGNAGENVAKVTSSSNADYQSNKAGFSIENATITISNATDEKTLGNTLKGTSKVVKEGEGTLNLTNTANTYTGGTEVKAGKLVAATGAALGKAGTTTISGGSLKITDAKATITKSAADTNAAVSYITGVTDGSGDVYSIGNAAYKVENAKVAIAADSATTISNRLIGVELVNNGTGAITAGNGYNDFTSINVTSGDIILKGLAAEAITDKFVDTVANLSIGENRTLSVYSNWQGTLTEATVKVTGSANFAAGARMNGNLVLSSGATVTMAGALTMGSTVTLGTGMTLSGDLVNTIKTMSDDGTVDLFTGVDALYLGNATVASATLDATSGVNLSEYFHFDGASNYYLGYNGTKVFAGVIPEPTTATLSLLALAGLAARRRRK